MSVHKFVDCAAGLGAALLLAAGLTPSLALTTEAQEPRVIEVLAQRYAFVPDRIEVTQGETVKLVVRSADGVHGVEIKKFKISKEVPRGSEPTIIEFTANAAGEFDISCLTYCGKGHERMKAKLVVTPRETRAQ